MCGVGPALRPAANFRHQRPGERQRSVQQIRQDARYTGDDCDECPACAECLRAWDYRAVAGGVTRTACGQRISLNVDTVWTNRLLGLLNGERPEETAATP